MNVEQTIVITAGESGTRLDSLLARRFPVLSREDWQGRIRSGHVLLRGRTARPSAKVHAGEQISFRYEKKPEPLVDKRVQIIFENEEAAVIDKPANLPVHPSGIYFHNTLAHVLREKWPEKSFRMVHRLDRETSGCMLLAKTKESAARLARQFLNGTIRKEYLVLVEGAFPPALDASGYLTSDRDSVIRKKLKFTYEKQSGSITARTEFLRIDLPGKIPVGISFLRARLHTGRMHQIRATLCSLGFPVVGDRLYGVDENLYLKFIHGEETDEDRMCLRMDRTALHSTLIEFETLGEMVKIERAIPDDMERLVDHERAARDAPTD